MYPQSVLDPPSPPFFFSLCPVARPSSQASRTTPARTCRAAPRGALCAASTPATAPTAPTSSTTRPAARCTFRPLPTWTLASVRPQRAVALSPVWGGGVGGGGERRVRFKRVRTHVAQHHMFHVSHHTNTHTHTHMCSRDWVPGPDLSPVGLVHAAGHRVPLPARPPRVSPAHRNAVADLHPSRGRGIFFSFVCVCLFALHARCGFAG